MKNNNIASAIAGGIFFAVPYLALSVPIVPALAIGSAAFCAGSLVFKKTKNISLKESNNSLYRILQNAKKENKHIIEVLPLIESNEIKDNLKEINDTVNKIIITIEKDPKKIKNVNNFFDYYLPVIVKIVDRYDEIENQRLSSSESKKFNESTNMMVKEANKAFKKILNNLYKYDMTDTNVEMKVFNSMLVSDGFDNEELNIDMEDKNG